MRHIPFVLAIALAAAPLTGAFASPSPQTDGAFDRAAAADLRHAGADLAPMRVTHPDKDGKGTTVSWQAPTAGRVAAARNWAENAETELLNRASYDADGALQPGTPITPDAAIGDIVTLRADTTKHALHKARHEDAVAMRAVQAEMPGN